METKAYEKNIAEIYHYFHKLWMEGKPIAKLFSTNSRGYIYDTGTNKILSCDPFEFNFLQYLMSMDIDKAIDRMLREIDTAQFIKTVRNIKNAIEKENILKTKKVTQLVSATLSKNIEEILNTRLRMILLETTERCNLRCGYCIYNPYHRDKRNHGNKDLTLEIAHKSIDYLADHNKAHDIASINFYGGEPLLRFPFIKSCVNYAQNKIREQEVCFALTTNATLITNEIAKYFSNNNFSITVSLDGPEEIHNEYRKDAKGQGSFKYTVNGLKNLIDVFGEKSKRILLNMVYAPPYSENKLNKIASLWDDLTWLPKNISTTITYPSPFSIPIEKIPLDNFTDNSLLEWAERKYMKNYTGKKSSPTFTNNLIEKKLASLFNRTIYEEPLEQSHLNGCCVPGVRKIYVQTNGNFSICERMPKSPSIGNVFTGINIDRIKDIYINDYSKKSLPSCCDCWAIHLCQICYVHAFKDGKFNRNTKNSYCSGHRFSLEAHLKYFCRLLEINPDGLNHLSGRVDINPIKEVMQS